MRRRTVAATGSTLETGGGGGGGIGGGSAGVGLVGVGSGLVALGGDGRHIIHIIMASSSTEPTGPDAFMSLSKRFISLSPLKKCD